MAKPWSQVAASPEFQALSPDQQNAAREQYFQEVVAPQVPKDQLDTAKSQFDADTAPKDSGSGFGAQLGRQLGLTARDAVNAVTGLPAMAGDALNAGVNAGIRGVNDVAGTKIPQLGSVSGAIDQAEDKIGLPKPASGTERIVNDIATAIGGAGGQAGAAKAAAGAMSNPAAVALLRYVAENPSQQIAAAATGAGAGSTAREAGVSPAGQAAAALAGGMAPSGLAAAGAAGTRYLLRGGEQNIPAIQKTIDTFRDAGTAPSVGQATGNRTAQAAESLLGKYPGSAGVMAKRGEEQASEIGKQVEKIADNLSPNATPSVAGRTIEKGLSGPGGFVDRFKDGQRALYDRLDQYIPADAKVDVTRTSKALAAMNENIEGAEALSKFFKNGKIQDIERALKSDTAGTPPGVMVVPPNPLAAVTGGAKGGYSVRIPGGSSTNQLPYEAMKKLRTLVGQELENNSLVSDVPRSKWKALYGALSSDLDQAAVATGNPDAAKAMQRANQFSRAGYERIGDILDKVAKQDIPEKIFKSAVNPADMQAGATKIGGIMKSLTTGERDVVKSAFIRRMGVASAGQQGAEGGDFSSQTFLTNWNKMSPQAKDVMFSSKDGNLRKSLDSIAQTADRIKEGGKVLANPSGTAPVVAATGLVSGIGTSLATGNYGVAAGLLASSAGANLTSKLMTNPRFVSWLARATKIQNPETALQAVQALGKTLQGEPGDVQSDAKQYAQSAGAALTGGAAGK